MMPETGERAPARMFVAVRAIAPVAGSPPKIGDAMLATPCATSSTFGSTRSSIAESDQVADQALTEWTIPIRSTKPSLDCRNTTGDRHLPGAEVPTAPGR